MQSIGAVNTIIRRPSDGKFVGHNTDYFGAISAIEDELRGALRYTYMETAARKDHILFSLFHVTGSQGLGKEEETASPLAGRVFVVMGAGGAGKAIAYGAKEKGARVVIANRTYGESSSSSSWRANCASGFYMDHEELELVVDRASPGAGETSWWAGTATL